MSIYVRIWDIGGEGLWLVIFYGPTRTRYLALTKDEWSWVQREAAREMVPQARCGFDRLPEHSQRLLLEAATEVVGA